MPLQDFKLKDVQPCKYRDFDLDPIRPENVADLVREIEQTGWTKGAASGRQLADGKLELAFGHHRLEALLELYGPTHVEEFGVEDWDDEQMLRKMAGENMPGRQSLVAHDLNVIAATVGAIARGELPGVKPLDPKTTASAIRYAPSYVLASSGESPEHPYIADSIADELKGKYIGKDGHASTRTKDALSALELIELKAIAPSEINKDVSPSVAQDAIRAARTRRTEEHARAKAERERAKKATADAEKAQKKAVADREKAEATAKQASAAKKQQAEELVATQRKLEAERVEEAKKRQVEQDKRAAAEKAAETKAAGEALRDSLLKASVKKEAAAEKKAAKPRMGKAKPPRTAPQNAAAQAKHDAEAEKMKSARKERERLLYQPNTPEGNAARKSQELIKKAISTIGTPESAASFEKAAQLIETHKLYIRVSVGKE